MIGEYDLITIGGGLGGCSLARAMAERGKRVVVLERETHFRDRVRGEYMNPWGVAEARELGIDSLVRASCGMDVRYVDMGFGPRDLPATTPQGLPALGFRHAEMQEVVLAAAVKAGAEVRRGAVVTDIKPGSPARVTFQNDGRTEEAQARLVAAADGRSSMARKWAKFTVREEPAPFLFAGLLLEGITAPAGHAYLLFNPGIGMATAITPVGNGCCRTYVAYQTSASYRLNGNENVPRFIEEATKAPQVAGYFGSAKAVGPLASFPCGEFWVEYPYKDGVALIGDSAATTDPAFGQGLSLTLRDVRVLRDQLSKTDYWDEAGRAYATEYRRYHEIMDRVEKWFRQIFLAQGPEAEERRAKAIPRIVEDQTRVPDHLISGPELPADEVVRKRFFGEA